MSIDWNKCIICQESTNEALKCPLNGNGSLESNRQVYAAFLENVGTFEEANLSPVKLQFSNDVDLECLCRNKASWHKSCRLKFSISKFKKAEDRVNRKRDATATADEKKGPEMRSAKCRKRQSVHEDQRSECLFCNKGDGNGKLRCFSMLETDKNVRQMALELGNFELLGRMSEGDLIAIEAKYHLKCLISLRNQYRSFCAQRIRDSNDGLDDAKLDESVAFVELVKYIDQCMDDGVHIFKLSELSPLYVQRLEDLGIEKSINKTRLKKALLEHYGRSSTRTK